MIIYCSPPLEGDVHAHILNLKYNSKINFKSVVVHLFKNMMTNHDVMTSNSDFYFFLNKIIIQLILYEGSNVSIQLAWILLRMKVNLSVFKI